MTTLSPSRALSLALRRFRAIHAKISQGVGLTTVQTEILDAIAKAPMTQADIIKLTGIDRCTLSDSLARMEAAGLVTRNREPGNIRAQLVTITPGHRRAMYAARRQVVAAERKLLAPLTEQQRAAFLFALGKVVEGNHA